MLLRSKGQVRRAIPLLNEYQLIVNDLRQSRHSPQPFSLRAESLESLPRRIEVAQAAFEIAGDHLVRQTLKVVNAGALQRKGESGQGRSGSGSISRLVPGLPAGVQQVIAQILLPRPHRSAQPNLQFMPIDFRTQALILAGRDQAPEPRKFLFAELFLVKDKTIAWALRCSCY
ncbi:hypothetical protein [Roseateles violae]|uniref:Uncharacterized protein n=1 Tax=Roseateles violae TaxID=3058042 RepID=A0ABT8DZ39_9BURK|nr:hypothetical protein [Pelomonas sp. PFR6]MDN3922861.1 hypothetical protein [Pelomonas sp. PFR6]